MCKIALRALFENFSYKYGVETYLQLEGGPIGARVSISAAHLVMQSWGEEYMNILVDANLIIDYLRGYVDDGRQVSTILAKGMRFVENKMRFEITQEGLDEDENTQETNNARMSRLCFLQ